MKLLPFLKSGLRLLIGFTVLWVMAFCLSVGEFLSFVHCVSSTCDVEWTAVV